MHSVVALIATIFSTDREIDKELLLGQVLKKVSPSPHDKRTSAGLWSSGIKYRAENAAIVSI